LEQLNVNNLKEFEKKIQLYEDKFNSLNNININSVKNNELESRKEINELKNENSQLKNKLLELDLNTKNNSEKSVEKLTKYKKNYKTIKEKLEKSEKEKDKIIKNITSSSTNNGTLKINQNTIQNFILNSEQVELLTQKISELERKYRDREEHYKQLCYNANNYQLNKEVDSLTKKFEQEKKEYIKLINQKNNELVEIKKECEDIFRELEELKYTKKLR
jgi:hypothetical protein